MEGKYVVVRSSPSGVWFGRLVAKAASAEGLLTVRLEDARRVHSWRGALSCSGLAAHGPDSANIDHPVAVEVAQVCEISEAQEEAIKKFAALPTWKPGS